MFQFFIAFGDINNDLKMDLEIVIEVISEKNESHHLQNVENIPILI